MHTLLVRRIRSQYDTLEDFCEDIELSRTALWEKLNGKRAFTVRDIKKICAVLKIPKKQIPTYFFD